MNDVPNIIAGAKVIWYTVVDDRHQMTGNTKRYIDGIVQGKAFGLAICKYDNEEGYYLFGCGKDWNSVTDTYHETVENAKGQAEFEYENLSDTWVEKQ